VNPGQHQDQEKLVEEDDDYSVERVGKVGENRNLSLDPVDDVLWLFEENHSKYDYDHDYDPFAVVTLLFLRVLAQSGFFTEGLAACEAAGLIAVRLPLVGS